MTKPILIGIGGALASGKDTCADQLVAEYGFMKFGMSDPLHTALLTLNPIIEMSSHSTMIRYADLTANLGYTAAKENYEYRRLLQALGTDVARQQWNDNFWVDLAANRIKAAFQDGHSVILTGIRFANEAAMVKNLDGHLWYVTRPTLSDRTRPYAAANAQRTPTAQTSAQHSDVVHTHASETSIDASAFDMQISNAGTLAQLSETVRSRYADILTR